MTQKIALALIASFAADGLRPAAQPARGRGRAASPCVQTALGPAAPRDSAVRRLACLGQARGLLRFWED